ncbi:MAG: hypothetical protein ABIH88_03480 [Patescibacteria group bacterium]|nr:hypothetical protein [Patescibacteria group bacterium]
MAKPMLGAKLLTKMFRKNSITIQIIRFSFHCVALCLLLYAVLVGN